MNCKERVLNSVKFQGVDRVPCGLFGTDFGYQWELADRIGCETVEEMYRKLDVDIWHTVNGLKYSGRGYKYRGKEINPWAPFYFERNPEPPFANITSVEQVLEYPVPAFDEYDASGYKRELKDHEEFSICGGINSAIFHNYLYMCGQINALCYLKTEPEIALAIIDKITSLWEVYLDVALEAADGRVDIIENCNDFGTQNSMFMSPEDFRVFFKPALLRLYKKIKDKNILLMQHSCGAVGPIIPDFIEMGADIFNPVQISASGMDFKPLIDKYKGKIAFYGGLDTQYLLPSGPPERIREETLKALSYFGREGGYILSGSQGLLEDIPIEHALAMLDPELRK